LIAKVFYAVGMALLLGTAACSDDPTDSGGQTFTVNMQASAFSPATLTIDRGDRVVWANQTATAHNVTPDNPGQAGVWSAATIAATVGAQFQHTFNTAGVFNYRCTIHAGMTGTITVN
jgi:plastocyanin